MIRSIRRKALRSEKGLKLIEPTENVRNAKGKKDVKKETIKTHHIIRMGQCLKSHVQRIVLVMVRRRVEALVLREKVLRNDKGTTYSVIPSLTINFNLTHLLM
tara:strand:+ start:703 stop:1011 length:309 start_codon:yes stop_codon:yes gene_type:complete